MDRYSTIKNMFWKLFERFGAQATTVLVSIVLARILDPELYGVIAFLLVTINVLQAFIDGGFTNALIQKKFPDKEDFSTVFWFNLFFSVMIYLILFFLAPLINATYVNYDILILVRVLGLVLIIYSFKIIQQAYARKTLQFKKFFYATLTGSIVSGIVGVVLALSGAGIWALVFQFLIKQSLH